MFVIKDENELTQRNSWIDEEESYRIRVRDHINRSPSPDKSFDDMSNNELRRTRYFPNDDNFAVQTQSLIRNLSPPLRYSLV